MPGFTLKIKCVRPFYPNVPLMWTVCPAVVLWPGKPTCNACFLNCSIFCPDYIYCVIFYRSHTYKRGKKNNLAPTGSSNNSASVLLCIVCQCGCNFSQYLRAPDAGARPELYFILLWFHYLLSISIVSLTALPPTTRFRLPPKVNFVRFRFRMLFVVQFWKMFTVKIRVKALKRHSCIIITL